MPVSKRSRPGGLQHQRRDDRYQIGVAAALADAIQRALHMANAGIDGCERIGNRLFRIIVCVNAEMVARDMLRHRPNDFRHFRWLRAAIGVAKNDPASAGAVGRLSTGKRIFRIGLVAIEEMLAIDDGFLARLDGSFNGSVDRLEIFLVRAAERYAHMIVPALTDETNRIRRRANEGAASPGSLETETPARLVMPKAANFAIFVRFSLKKAVSVGLAPG